MDENWGRPTPNLYVYLICAVFLGPLFIIIISHPDFTSKSEDRVGKSTEGLLLSKKNESFQFDCNVKNPCSKGACELKQKIICHRESISSTNY